jgi:hypothetical protein
MGVTAPPSAYSDTLAAIQAETTQILMEHGTMRLSCGRMGVTGGGKATGKKGKTDRHRRKERKKGKGKGRKVKVRKSYRNKAVENVPESIQAADTMYPGGYDREGEMRMLEGEDTLRNSGAAATVEIFDDDDEVGNMYDSDDSGGDREEFARVARESNERLEGFRREERSQKELTFKAEEERVRSSMDAFGTGEDVTLTDLQRERDRLDRILNIHNFEAAREAEVEMERKRRMKWEVKDRMANKVRNLGSNDKDRWSEGRMERYLHQQNF